jgi:hypothetical protein
MCRDVELQLGHDDKNGTTRIFVSSQVMSVASPVFNTMFRPKAYKEGSILAREGLVQVSLPDDSPQAMAVLCDIFHLQSSKVPLAHITVDLLDEIATMVDKYDCAEAIQPWPEFWLVQESIQSSLKQHERFTFGQAARWTHISCHLGYRELFEKFTSIMSRLANLEDMDEGHCRAFSRLSQMIQGTYSK